jgi:hypothetical protein
VKIPGAERAVIDPAKVQNYLLSQEHPVGRAKARFFAQLGFSQENWTILRDELYRSASLEAQLGPAPFHELDTVVLIRDIPEAGLRSGDLGAVVQVYGAEALEVECVTASGRTQALLTVPTTDVRPVRDDDLLAVRTSPVRGAA